MQTCCSFFLKVSPIRGVNGKAEPERSRSHVGKYLDVANTNRLLNISICQSSKFNTEILLVWSFLW